MISYEGKTRECANCGHVTNVHSHCATCDMTFCEGCEHTCVDELDEEFIREEVA
jgi:hypothetical protein